MAILWGWPGPRGVEGKGCGIWTDGGIGGMVCVVGMRGRQQGAGQWVCSCSILGLEARPWTQRMRDDGGKGSRSQKRGRTQVEIDSGRGGGVRRQNVFMLKEGFREEKGKGYVSRTMLAAGGDPVWSDQH